MVFTGREAAFSEEKTKSSVERSASLDGPGGLPTCWSKYYEDAFHYRWLSWLFDWYGWDLHASTGSPPSTP
jgi:hypothetical protein